MKKSNSTQKALAAFRKLGAVVLITATLALFFTACKQTSGGGEGGKSTPKHAITFSVDSTTPNGTLTAKVDGGDITSGKEVEQGKTVTFTAKANDGYRVKGWTLDDSPITEVGTNTEYKLKVSKAVTVKVSFEAIPPTKYTVTLNKTEHGKVTASPEIPTDGKMPKDTVITFTAEANAGYKIGKWTVTPETALQAGTGADGSETAKVKITADTTVKVSFEANSNPPNPPTLPNVPSVEGGAVLILSPDKLTIKVTAKTADGSAIQVEGCNETTLTSDVKTTLNAKGKTITLKGKITELDFRDEPSKKQCLTALNVQGLTSLRFLNCYDNKLTELNVQGLTALQELYCSSNQLTALNVQDLTALQWLECYGNQLSELNVQGLTSLRFLNCYDNKLTELNVQSCVALQSLNCSRNQLSELNVQGLTSLQTLVCYDNKLTELIVQSCVALQGLNCSSNQLSELNVQGLTSLQTLGCFGNQLTELNVQGCVALLDFHCYDNKLTVLDVQGLTALKSLHCVGNQIKAQAMTKLLNALPARVAGDNANAGLYTEATGKVEGNHKDLTQPAELKKAFDEAKKRNWKLKKINASGNIVDI